MEGKVKHFEKQTKEAEKRAEEVSSALSALKLENEKNRLKIERGAPYSGIEKEFFPKDFKPLEIHVCLCNYCGNTIESLQPELKQSFSSKLPISSNISNDQIEKMEIEEKPDLD